MTRIGSLTLATVLVAGGAVGAAGLLAGRAPYTALPSRPVWIETAWPFPLDPWGKPYVYKVPGQKWDFELLSYGRDGRPGGNGEDADIGNN